MIVLKRIDFTFIRVSQDSLYGFRFEDRIKRHDSRHTIATPLAIRIAVSLICLLQCYPAHCSRPDVPAARSPNSNRQMPYIVSACRCQIERFPCAVWTIYGMKKARLVTDIASPSPL